MRCTFAEQDPFSTSTNAIVAPATQTTRRSFDDGVQLGQPVKAKVRWTVDYDVIGFKSHSSVPLRPLQVLLRCSSCITMESGMTTHSIFDGNHRVHCLHEAAMSFFCRAAFAGAAPTCDERIRGGLPNADPGSSWPGLASHRALSALPHTV